MPTPAEQIDKMLADLPDWRGERLFRLRTLINEADANLKEDWKWGVPTWTYNGNVIGIAAFKEHVKVNFFKGASLPDPEGLFNAGRDAKTSRSIDLQESDSIDEQALSDLIRAAANANAKR